MKVKTHIIEIPTERFVVKIRGIEIVVSDVDDLDRLIEKYKVDEIRPINPPDPSERGE